MRALLAIIFTGLLALGQAQAYGATRTFADVNEDLTPVLTGLQTDLTGLQTLLTDLFNAGYAPKINDVGNIAVQVKNTVTDIKEAASDGLAILDGYTTEACAADYIAISRTGFLMLLDGATNMLNGNPGSEIWGGQFLLFNYAELQFEITDCEGKVERSPRSGA